MMTTTDGFRPHRPIPPRTASALLSEAERSTHSLPPARRALPPRTRRRPALLALGVALMAMGVLSGVWLVNRAGERVSVLVVTQAVPFGQVITADDLVRAEVSVDPSVATIPASDIGQVVGRFAATDLTPGALLSQSAVIDGAPPSPGEVLVALAVPATRMPAGSFQAGDKVLVVGTPAADADVPSLPPSTIPATVVRLGQPDLNGVTVIDVTVTRADGPALAARSATGRIAVVLQPRGR